MRLLWMHFLHDYSVAMSTAFRQSRQIRTLVIDTRFFMRTTDCHWQMWYDYWHIIIQPPTGSTLSHVPHIIVVVCTMYVCSLSVIGNVIMITIYIVYMYLTYMCLQYLSWWLTSRDTFLVRTNSDLMLSRCEVWMAPIRVLFTSMIWQCSPIGSNWSPITLLVSPITKVNILI